MTKSYSSSHVNTRFCIGMVPSWQHLSFEYFIASFYGRELTIENCKFTSRNVRHVNGMFNISLEIFPKKDALTEKKKIQNTWETIGILEIQNAVM